MSRSAGSAASDFTGQPCTRRRRKSAATEIERERERKRKEVRERERERERERVCVIDRGREKRVGGKVRLRKACRRLAIPGAMSESKFQKHRPGDVRGTSSSVKQSWECNRSPTMVARLLHLVNRGQPACRDRVALSKALKMAPGEFMRVKQEIRRQQ